MPAGGRSWLTRLATGDYYSFATDMLQNARQQDLPRTIATRFQTGQEYSSICHKLFIKARISLSERREHHQKLK